MTFAIDGPPLMPGELAKAMRCSRPIIDRALRDGVIPHVRLGRRIFIPRPVVAEILLHGRIPQVAEGDAREA
jgi:excisionase family DNA binding protein